MSKYSSFGLSKNLLKLLDVLQNLDLLSEKVSNLISIPIGELIIPDVLPPW
jgi:hypothetical protein